MAKVVCKNCGTKNPSSAVSCSNCGSFLVDDVSRTKSQPQSYTQPDVSEIEENQQESTESTPENVEARPYDGPVETVKVPGGNSTQWLSMAVTFGILGVFLALEYLGFPLPSYSIYIFLVLIFIIPSLLRRVGTSVKFNQMGFSIPDRPELEPVQFDNIMNAKLGMYSRYEQSVTLYFKGSEPALKLDFNSMTNFRSLIMMLNRRRIPIVRENRTANPNQQPSA